MRRRTYLATLTGGLLGGGVTIATAQSGAESSSGANTTAGGESDGAGRNGTASAIQCDPGTANTTNATAGTDSVTVAASESLAVLSHEWYEEEFSAGVTGKLRNTSGNALDYVQAKAVFLDADGVQLETGMDNTTDLAADGSGSSTWCTSVITRQRWLTTN